MLVHTLSCRENWSRSGEVARVAGAAVGADAHLPTMATQDFLSCLSKKAMEAVATSLNVRLQPTGKATRRDVISKMGGTRWVHPAAAFSPEAATRAADEEPGRHRDDDLPDGPGTADRKDAAADGDGSQDKEAGDDDDADAGRRRRSPGPAAAEALAGPSRTTAPPPDAIARPRHRAVGGHPYLEDAPMTQHATTAGTRPLTSAAISHPAPPRPGSHLDPGLLRLGLMLRREALAGMEEDLVEECEVAAGLGDSHRTSDPTDRTRWDRAAWGRYLAAAVRLEGRYGPPMRRLRDDIARLERLLDLATNG